MFDTFRKNRIPNLEKQLVFLFRGVLFVPGLININDQITPLLLVNGQNEADKTKCFQHN